MKCKTASALILFWAIGVAASQASPIGFQEKTPADIKGVWDIVPGDDRLLTGNAVEFLLKDGRWAGHFTAASGSSFPLASVNLEGDMLSFSFLAIPGEPESAWFYAAKIVNGRMAGTCRYSAHDDEIPFTAEKRKV